MGVCDLCGNDYDKTFAVIYGDATYVFDSFECAISLVAPRCHHCDGVIIGHGTETGAGIFCCAHCARLGGGLGAAEISDRAPEG